jgi:hypothetical protein
MSEDRTLLSLNNPAVSFGCQRRHRGRHPRDRISWIDHSTFRPRWATTRHLGSSIPLLTDTDYLRPAGGVDEPVASPKLTREYGCVYLGASVSKEGPRVFRWPTDTGVRRLLHCSKGNEIAKRCHGGIADVGRHPRPPFPRRQRPADVRAVGPSPAGGSSRREHAVRTPGRWVVR